MTVPASSPVDDALDRHRSEADYIDRTIATVRNHREADNCWPQWANIFADEIEDLRADVQRLRDQVKFCPYCAGAFVPESLTYEGPCEGCKIAERLREERDAAWTTQGRYFREALAAEAEVRRLTALKDEVVELSAKLERGLLNASAEIVRLTEGLRETADELASRRGMIDRAVAAEKFRALLAARGGANTEGGEA